MSFKREGDDYGALGILKKRRVAELFTNDIPDEEALLCSNGRFACTVCKHKPVFDTINMLAVHRKGKKHLANAAMVTAEKQELAELVLKRQQDVYLNSGNNADLHIDPSSNYGGLLTSSVYEPRMIRPKVKPHERKPRLDLSSVQQSSQPKEQNSVPFNSTTNPTFKNFKKDFLRQQEKADDGQGGSVSTGPTGRYGIRQLPEPRVIDGPTSTADIREVIPCPASESKQTVPQQPSYVHQKYFKKKHYICDRVGKTSTCISNDEQEKREKYLQLRGAGWKKDWCGKWVKEEGVEFDSDEEPPDIP